MEFYKILLEIMEEKHLSIPEVARMSNLTDSTVRSIIDRKQKKVALNIAFKMSDGLGVSLHRLNGEFSCDSSGSKKERPAEAPLDKLDEEILDRLKAFPCPEIAKQHILSYLDLLENEMSSFLASHLTVEEAEELNKIIEETYPDQSTDFQKSAG